MLRTVLLLAGLWVASGWMYSEEKQDGTHVTSDRRIENLSTFASCTHRLRPGPARFPRHDTTFCTDMTFHADVGILPRGYSNWGIA